MIKNFKSSFVLFSVIKYETLVEISQANDFSDSISPKNFVFFLAFNFHDGNNEHLALINVNGGDDALSAFWHDLGSETPLYASHADFVQRVAQIHEAHW